MTAQAAARDLTGRELEVMRLLAAGQTREQIGDALGVHVDTVKTHCKRIYQALGATNAVHAVHLAWQLGLFGDPTRLSLPPIPPRWLVWSTVANAWWGPTGREYTTNLIEAGRFTEARAVAACSARRWLSPVRPPEVAVLAPECWPGGQPKDPAVLQARLRYLIADATRTAVTRRNAAAMARAAS